MAPRDLSIQNANRQDAEDRASRGQKKYVPQEVRTGAAGAIAARTSGPFMPHGNTGFGKGGEQPQLNNPPGQVGQGVRHG